MYILVAYDVATSTHSGARRLRRVAKVCLDYGQRVQNSVFECKLDPAHYVAFKERILHEIDPSTDSVRIYNLGNNWQKRVEHYGKNKDYNIEGTLLV
jgi:CRISPR-associated protein Cas2